MTMLQPEPVASELSALAISPPESLRLLSLNVQVGISNRSLQHYLSTLWQHLLPSSVRMSTLDKVGGLLKPFDIVALQEARQVALIAICPENIINGILVNAISPGPVITNIGGGRLKMTESRRPFEKATPLGRIAEPSDLYGAALFLASPASSMITGTQIVVDGGRILGMAD